MKLKRMLVVRCSEDFIDEQITFLHNFLELLGFELFFVDGLLELNFKECKYMFDYLYLTGHSNEDSFGEINANFSWELVAETIENSLCISDSCKLIIKSCKSVDENIAKIMFTKTSKIQQVLGSVTDTENFSSYVGSMLFFYLTEWNNLNPSEAVSISNNALNINFKSFSRT